MRYCLRAKTDVPPSVQGDLFSYPMADQEPDGVIPLDVFRSANLQGVSGVVQMRAIAPGSHKFTWHFCADYAWKTGVKDVFGLSFETAKQVYENFIQNGGILEP